jgi:oxygen-independent coproporphyrinogen-3 oxidase
LLFNALSIEWQRKLPCLKDHRIVSIYFGGGTPSLAPHCVAKTLQLVRNSASLSGDCEITVEVNPDSVDESLYCFLLESNVNRLSLGVQSFDDLLLGILKRPYCATQARNAILSAYRAGFSNISIDLMYDLPSQTRESWRSTLEELQSLPIAHCSLYNLTIEPCTPFFFQKKELQKSIPDNETSLDLLNMAVKKLKQLGLMRYEISAFSRIGFESRHNSGYWIGRPFLGFGPSAFSFWEGRRFQNISHFRHYSCALLRNENIISFEEELSQPASINEWLAVRLRLLDGAPAINLPPDTVSVLQDLENEGYLTLASGRWQLTEKGLLFYDTVAERIV